MRVEMIEQKINDLDYRIKLEETAIKSAEYNLKFAKRLNYDSKKVDSLKETLDFYNSKIVLLKNLN